MPVTYNADEIFEIAQQIERNGGKFYRKAADSLDQPEPAKLLRQLAAMEDDHLRTFTEMRKRLTDADRQALVSDPYGEAALYLQAVADGKIFDVREDPSRFLTGNESIQDILLIAIGIEKESVIYYTGVRESVPGDLGKEKMSRIIREELGHVAALSRMLP